jgi:putative colanic acid biosynthesis UDP-glucose lipid carrier transferase
MNAFRFFYSFTKTVSDQTVLSLCFLFALAFTKNHLGIEPGHLISSSDLTIALSLNIGWNFTARLTGLYDEFRSRSRVFQIKAILRGILFQIVFVMLFAFFTGLVYIRYFFIASYALCLVAALPLWNTVMQGLFHFLRLNGRNLRNFILVGNGSTGEQFLDMILISPQMGYRMIGCVDDVDRSVNLGALYRGKIDDLERIIRDENIDEVMISLPSGEGKKVRRVIEACEQHPVMIRMIPDFLEQLSSRFTISLFRDFPIITIRRNPLDEMQWRIAKRVFDVAFSVCFLAFIATWLFPLLALLVKMTSRGPVFFRQERQGKKNERIICYKFRSMMADSTDLDEKGAYRQATKDDPRTTRIGRFLRKTNLDELPQFLNVISGEMSVVGPRPHPIPLNEQSAGIVDKYMVRHLVKPGITGWAQIHGLRGNTQDPELMRKRIAHDIWYIENWSFFLDLNIILLTTLNIFRGDKNAY